MTGRPKDVEKGNWIRRPGPEGGFGSKWYRVTKVKKGSKYTKMTIDTGEVLEYDSTEQMYYETHAGYARND